MKYTNMEYRSNPNRSISELWSEPMTYEEVRTQMKICRCLYRGITNKHTAYEKNWKRINAQCGGKQGAHYLLKYNYDLYEAKIR